MVEPRVILRALCPTSSGRLRVLGEDGSFWERLARAAVSSVEFVGEGRTKSTVDRRCEGFAGVAGDLFTSGETVLVAVADVPRRREGLEAIVAGLAPEGMAVASWADIAADAGLAREFGHLVALDPPPLGRADPLLARGDPPPLGQADPLLGRADPPVALAEPPLGAGPKAHLAWGPAEAEFALRVYRAELDLRPALTEVYRALRALPPETGPDALQAALAGSGRYPRTPSLCARLIAVLTELELVALDVERRICELRDGIRTDLSRSATYRACGERLAAVERALAVELPQAGRARAA
jgi:hypothetical protein